MSLMAAPPVDLILDSAVQEVTTLIVGTLAAMALLDSLIDWKPQGRLTFPLLYLAGGMLLLIEPLVDVVGGCWLPVNDQIVVCTAYGRPMPQWLRLIYFGYLGVDGFDLSADGPRNVATPDLVIFRHICARRPMMAAMIAPATAKNVTIRAGW